MKSLKYLFGFICAISVIVILLITSVEAVTYWIPGYYENEYTKYNVANDVNMEMEDLLHVTSEMMSYLRGNRDNLNIPTVVNGIEREFFNEREIAHMEDVRNLFIGAIKLRFLCIVAAFISVMVLLVLKSNLKLILSKTFCLGSGLFFAVSAFLFAVISTDFSKYFIVFHHIFFTNDLWILDPSTDLLINIVPEPFFMDTALRIGLTFGLSVCVLFIISLIYLRHSSKK